MKTFYGLLAFVLLGLTGCEKADPPQDDATRYRVTGILQRMKGEKVAIIDHEEIPGYMAKMIMPFKLRDAAEMEGIKPGAQIEFDYVVTDLESWIENVTDTGKTAEIQLGKPQKALDDTTGGE